MNSKNIVIGVLILTTIAGGIYGWQQRRRASDLEAQNLKLAQAAAKRATRDAQQQHSHSSAPAPDDTGAAPAQKADASSKKAAAELARAKWEQARQSPQVKQIMAMRQRAKLDEDYAPLFKTLNLAPDQLEKFKDLLVDRQNAEHDVRTVAQEQGLNRHNSADRSEIDQLIDQAQADVDNNIRAAIGQDKFAQYQYYEDTGDQRDVVDQIDQSLSYTSAPLTPEQNAQLVALLARNAPQDNTHDHSPSITNQVINDAQSFLSPEQIDALRQRQALQAGHQQMHQMMHQKQK